MVKYCYQKFLLDCDYKSINLQDIPRYTENVSNILEYGSPMSLFDIDGSIQRLIEIETLDELDTEDDWVHYLDRSLDIDIIVILLSPLETDNSLIKNYREDTIKAYIYRLQQAHSNTNMYVA